MSTYFYKSTYFYMSTYFYNSHLFRKLYSTLKFTGLLSIPFKKNIIFVFPVFLFKFIFYQGIVDLQYYIIFQVYNIVIQNFC